jgi:hypothetical protein
MAVFPICENSEEKRGKENRNFNAPTRNLPSNPFAGGVPTVVAG